MGPPKIPPPAHLVLQKQEMDKKRPESNTAADSKIAARRVSSTTSQTEEVRPSDIRRISRRGHVSPPPSFQHPTLQQTISAVQIPLVHAPMDSAPIKPVRVGGSDKQHSSSTTITRQPLVGVGDPTPSNSFSANNRSTGDKASVHGRVSLSGMKASAKKIKSDLSELRAKRVQVW